MTKNGMVHRVAVAPFANIGKILDYAVPGNLRPVAGSLVEVPLGPRSVPAVVLPAREPSFAGALRPIGRILRPHPVVDGLQFALMDWMVARHGHSLSALLDLAVPMAVRKAVPDGSGDGAPLPPQEIAPCNRRTVPRPTLLEGRHHDRWAILASSIADALADGDGQILLLCPTVGLVKSMLALASKTFTVCDQWHGGISQRQRAITWEQLRMGRSTLLVGTASSLLLPLPRLRLVAVEREESFDHFLPIPIPFHGREVAIRLAELHAIPCILSSLVPSLESVRRVQLGHLAHRRIPPSIQLPPVATIDLSEIPATDRQFSPVLRRRLANCVESGGQAILIHPRRGIAHLRCARCGLEPSCPSCGIPIAVGGNGLLCCGKCHFTAKVAKFCIHCGGFLQKKRPGTGRLESVFRAIFPGIRCARCDREGLTDSKLRALHREFLNRHWDVLLGTSLAAVGLDSPNLALVALLDGDSLLQGTNFRGGELALQRLATFLDKMPPNGQLLIQTHHPHHPILTCLCGWDWKQFLDVELQERKLLGYPPFRHLVIWEWSGPVEEELLHHADRWAPILQNACQTIAATEVKGPTIPSIPRRRGNFLVEFWIFTPQPEDVIAALPNWLAAIGKPPAGAGHRILVDVA
ncbi:MAG: primosomal protein N' [Puniceicoccales bacterium]|jgi:primosomal protein N' (replication factor Y)|nr:primosomal protein N' [Puniceicoccales bacterium]